MVKKRGFTLIELTISIGIILILTVVTALVVNPSELLKKSKDSQRVQDVHRVSKAIELAVSTGLDLGASNIAYISIPQDAGGDCPEISTPLQPGYSYTCSPLETFQATNGTGWVPINLAQAVSQADQSGFSAATAETVSSFFASLPVDPLNDGSVSSYYGLIVGGRKHSVVTRLESEVHQPKMLEDEGKDPDFYEVGPGSNLWAAATGADALVAYWPLNDEEGVAAKDYSDGNAYPGVLQGVPTWTKGRVGGALEFDGVDDYIDVPDSESVDLNSAGSISLWFKLTGDWGSGRHIVFSKGLQNTVSGKVNNGFDISASVYTGVVDSKMGGPNEGDWLFNYIMDFDLADDPDGGAWHHLVVTWNGVEQVMYLDGVDDPRNHHEMGALAPVLDTTVYPFRIGANNGSPDDPFEGIIDEIRVYNRALSATEVASIYSRSAD